MVKKTFTFDIDIKKARSTPPPELVEGDNGNEFAITLTDNGEPVDLTDCRVLVLFSQPNGRTAQQDNDGNGVTMDETAVNKFTVNVYTTSFSPGTNNCEIQVLSGEGYGTLVTSAQFNFECRRSILNDDTIQSTDEYPILVGLVQRVEEVEEKLLPIEENEDARIAAEEERIAAETARQEAETEREQAELLREQEEEDRIADEEIRIGNEVSRKEAENQRYLAESGRVSAETARANAEAERVKAETTRQQNETARVSAETARVTAENARVSAETARVAAETAREKKWNNPTATASTLAAGASASATVKFTTDSVAFTFGVPKGDTGAKGDKGDTGAQGPQGEKGDKGDKGDTGTTGPQGPQGVKGDTGFGFVVLGYYTTIIELETAVTAPNAGDAYGIGTEEPYDIYVWDGTNSVWVNNGPLQGAKGDKGDTGPQGPQGPQGEKGDKGDTGPQGPQGIQGVQGETGPAGPAGADGAPGPAGADGDPGIYYGTDTPPTDGSVLVWVNPSGTPDIDFAEEVEY